MRRRSFLAGSALAIPILSLGRLGSLAQSATTPDVRLSLRVEVTGDAINQRDLVDRTARIISNRGLLLGADEVVVNVDDGSRLVVDLTGVANAGDAIRTLTSRGLLELIDPRGEFLETGMLVRTTFGGDPWTTADGTPVALPAGEPYETIVNSEDIVEAYASADQFDSPVVGFRLSERAATDFEAYTSTHLEQPMSIVVDSRVVSSPIIMAPISTGGVIAGLSDSEVESLVVQLSTAPLPARVTIERVEPAES
jgi:preprotein translocase subunit SecD